MEQLTNMLKNRTVVIGIVCSGYVGLPVAVTFFRKFTVGGCDDNDNSVTIRKHEQFHAIDIDRRLTKYPGEERGIRQPSAAIAQNNLSEGVEAA
jgi:UDP-N-acetyl-D-mannosaminuronate dehydrogenase